MQENEVTWLLQAKKGSIDAFSSLIDIYQRPVFNLCYRMLDSAEDAEDAAQETFMRAYKFIKSYDQQRPFGTWLLSIAAHYCIDQIRKRRLILISIDEEPYLDVKDNQDNPEDILLKKESDLQIGALLKRLSPVDRAAVVLYYWYDYSQEEIADSLSLSVSAIKSRLHRARKEMAQTWLDKQYAPVNVDRRSHESPVF